MAENDLLDIFRYGIEHYGLVGAERYKCRLERTLRPLSENPRLAWLRYEIRSPVCASSRPNSS